MRRALLALALATASSGTRPASLHAQVVTRNDTATVAAQDMALLRARSAAEQGDTPRARVLLDSLVNGADPAGRRYPDLLYWRATFSATAVDAERDYRRLVVEHATSPRAADALLRLAQLELARGDQALAMRHLERLVLEHADSPNRGRASYWMGRALLEQGDATRGCEALRVALGALRAEEAELRTQVTYAGRTCPRMEAAAVSPVAAPAASTTPPTVGGPPPTTTMPPPPRAGTTDSAPVAAPPRAAPAVPVVPAATPPVVVATPPAPVTNPAAPRAQPPAAPVTQPTAPVTKPPSPVTPPAVPAPKASVPATAPAGPPRWSVQVAAYDTRADAETLVRRLAARGHEARVTGTAKPFRVRIGRWTRADAVRQVGTLQAKGIAGYLVEAEPEEGGR